MANLLDAGKCLSLKEPGNAISTQNIQSCSQQLQNGGRVHIWKAEGKWCCLQICLETNIANTTHT